MPIRNWHICISGFRQHTGEPSGMHKLWVSLGVLRSPDTCVLLREWNADWRELANLIHLADGTRQRVYIYAYSWGAGYGFPRLARYLGDRGIHVIAAVLADPVYRSWLFSTRWLALTPWPWIRIPLEVDEVHRVCQKEDYPRGHQLVAESRSTVIHPPVLIERTHAFVDESPEFHSLCLSVAGASQ